MESTDKNAPPKAVCTATQAACVLALDGNTDAKAWAKEWAKTMAEHPGAEKDEGTMMSWFSMAIMAGYTAGRIDNRTTK